MPDARLTEIAERIERIAHYVMELDPDTEADPLATSGIEDMTQHLAGLIWQELDKIRPLMKEVTRGES